MADAKYENFRAGAYDGYPADAGVYDGYEYKKAVRFSALGSSVWPWIKSYEETGYEIGGKALSFVEPGTFTQFNRAFVTLPVSKQSEQMKESLKYFSDNNALTYTGDDTMRLRAIKTKEAIMITAWTLTTDNLVQTYDKLCEKGITPKTDSRVHKALFIIYWLNRIYKNEMKWPDGWEKIFWDCLTMNQINKYELTAESFADGVLPERIWIALQGGGGSGGTFAGADGDGGGAGAFAMASVVLNENEIYDIYVGNGGTAPGSPAPEGNRGHDTWLCTNGKKLLTAGGGSGGGNLNHPGAGGTVKNYMSAAKGKIALDLKGGDGGDGDKDSGKGQAIGKDCVSCVRDTDDREAETSVDNLSIPGGKSEASLAGGWTGTGGASAWGDGGKGGKHGTAGYGLAGACGSGGGGGRYLFIGYNKGGDGGDGFALILC